MVDLEFDLELLVVGVELAIVIIGDVSVVELVNGRFLLPELTMICLVPSSSC